MTTLPTREQIEDAPALEFEKPKKRQRGVTIQLCYHGALVSFSFAADGAPQIHEIEQSIDTLLSREGWSVPQAAAVNGKRQPAAERVKPFYDGDGEATCPVHRKPLAEGRYGLYCQCRAKGDEAANDKGYCSLRFIED